MLDRLASTHQSQRDLLANIAHELRTPLTSVQGYAQALQDGVITRPPDRDKALVAISEESARMGSLVEQILQLSRLESGQLPLILQTVQIDELLAQVRRQFAQVALDRDVDFAVNAATDLTLRADPELLVQALGNLVSNAIRHTPQGGTVEIRATRIASASRPPGIRITVADTGVGIEQEQLERLFERFYRGGDQSTSRDGRNFGLGLAIVHEVVERHEGQISIESTPGQGTFATIDLPLDPTDQTTV
jgi:signal transduction histidine kinase